MDKRYQVFVSSTYADLQDERQHVIRTLMEMDCIPSSMEFFPSIDEEQFEFIKKVIDDCDYYILILGARYGTLDPEGMSYTEKEFDYAIEKGLKVLTFVHADPLSVAVNKTDNDPERARRLTTFRKKVMTGRLVKQWSKAEELPGMVALSLGKTIKMYPSVGWVRATSAGSEELLAQLNILRIEKEKLQVAISELGASSYVSPNLASMAEKFNVHGRYTPMNGVRKDWGIEISWGDLFALISPNLLATMFDEHIIKKMTQALFGRMGLDGRDAAIDSDDFHTIKIQFKALGLIQIEKVGSTTTWSLTPHGEAVMLQLRAVRSKVAPVDDHDS